MENIEKIDEIQEIITKCGLFIGVGDHIYPRHKVSVKDKEFILSHKEEIRKILEQEDIEREKERIEKEKKQEEERIKSYSFLFEKLPVRNITSTPNQEKFENLRKQIEEIKFFPSSDEENEGLNLNLSHKKAQLEAEAQKFCSHQLKTSYSYSYTADARKKLIRTISCEICGLYIRDEVEAELDKKAYWN